MKLDTRYVLPLSALALAAAAGCATERETSTVTMGSSGQGWDETAPAEPDADGYFTFPVDEQIAFAGAPEFRVQNRGTAVVGFYGEHVGQAGHAEPGSDGGGNLTQVTFTGEGDAFDPCVDTHGKHLYFASTQHSPSADLYRKSVDGRTVTQLTADPADDLMPSVSPDGTRVAFASNRSGNWDIYVMPASGGQAVQVTTDPDDELHPSWSPDGKLLSYSRFGTQSRRWEIWVVSWQQTGIRHFLDYGQFPRWCPDPAQSRLLFQRSRRRGDRFYSAWTVDYVDGDALNPTEIVAADNAAVINPVWSPDGTRIAFATVLESETTRDRPTQCDIWIAGVDGTGRTTITNGSFANFQPCWSPDGRIFFVSDRSGTDNIWSVSTNRAIKLVEPMEGEGDRVAGVPTDD